MTRTVKDIEDATIVAKALIPAIRLVKEIWESGAGDGTDDLLESKVAEMLLKIKEDTGEIGS